VCLFLSVSLYLSPSLSTLLRYDDVSAAKCWTILTSVALGKGEIMESYIDANLFKGVVYNIENCLSLSVSLCLSVCLSFSLPDNIANLKKFGGSSSSSSSLSLSLSLSL